MTTSSFSVSFDKNTPLSGSFPAEKIHGIYDLCRQLVATNTLSVLLDSIVRQSVEILHVRISRILTLEPDGSFLCQAAYSSDSLDFACRRGRKSDRQSQALYQRVLLGEGPVMLGQGSALPSSLRSSLRLSHKDTLYLVPLRVNQEAVGVLVLGEESWVAPEAVLNEKMRLAVMIADQAASAIYRARLSYRLEESQLQTVLVLAKVMESRDAYIGGHCRKVTAVSVRLARKLGCSQAEIQAVRWAAMLHDIGKVGIRDDVLNKKGPLSRDEWTMVYRHPEMGADIVRMASNLNYVAGLIHAHHEHFNGKGYPNGLQREMIPFGARILAVADAYSAMTDDRPYRESCTLEEVIAELKRCSGAQFDPQVVDAFIELFG
jgi:putative nucleotidyltransferase with HDIG domain